MQKIITLTTDFGVTDEYAGIMKGILKSNCPDSHIIDITHGIRSHDVRQAAYILYAAHRFFKPGTIHVIVVDPGVGSKRRIILAQANDQFFLTPDNGTLSLFALKNLITACRVVECQDLFIQPVSRTFQGRDIMAPVAARLAGGMPAANVGPATACDTLTVLPLPQPTFDKNEQVLAGTIIDSDRFGNLTTNIHKDDVKEFFSSVMDKQNFCLQVANTFIHGLSESYSEVSAGSILIIIGSRDYLEIAVNQGSALNTLGVSLDDPVSLRGQS